MTDTRDVARCWAGFASLGAGLVHLAVVREHVAESAVLGVFFLVAGLLQLVWALAALARDRLPVPRLVATGQLALVALWALDRTLGIPLGPDAWTPEPLGTADLLCVVLEVCAAAAIGAWLLVTRRVEHPDLKAGRYLALVGAGALVVAALTTPALAATEAGGHAHSHGSSQARAR